MLFVVPMGLLLLMVFGPRRRRTVNRQRALAASLLIVGLIAPACAASGQDEALPLVTLDASEPIATTAPVGIPLIPTPTALMVPPTPPPTATPLTTPQPIASSVDAGAAATSTRAATPTSAATPTPAVPTVGSQATADEPTPTAIPPTPAPTVVPTPEPTPTPTPELAPTPEPTVPPLERVVISTGHQPLGQASTIALTLPVGRIELIGFHEAGHPGSTAINAAWTGVEMITLASRSRGTHERSAADIVVPPGEPVVAPVTGTVVASGPYVLYCEYDDGLVYIEPDGLPGWQVRLFHVTGETPAIGTRVEAGTTVIASGARQLPFESQVDEFTSEPSWPHVHLEVVDTSVPDTRPPGPGCD